MKTKYKAIKYINNFSFVLRHWIRIRLYREQNIIHFSH